MPRSASRTGRVHPHERDTNDFAQILGANLSAPDNALNSINDTLSMSMGQNCRKDYRRRLNVLINFWKSECPEYFAVGVRSIPQNEREDSQRYYFHHTKDLIYTGLNVQYLLHFLVSTKLKKDGNFKSIQDLRKYKDSIMWGAKMVNEQLPTSFYAQVDRFLNAYKKEFAKAKKDGKVDDMAADPIPQPLYQLILQWAVEKNNILVWFWTTAQWNCMACSASIDPLSFHNISLGVDSLVVKYDESKADKAGERLSEKNIYANPTNYLLCFWTAMGIYCSLNKERLAKHERLFRLPNSAEGTSATRYCQQVVGIVLARESIVKNHMKVGSFNPYGFWKGSATYACSGTTAAPSIPSIARRGEWSIGSVLDAYWHFGSVGDQYLGRVLSGLDPNKSSFATLPPHWTIPDPLGNDEIKEGMLLTFGPILETYERKTDGPISILLRCFANIVYHSESLIEMMVAYPGHDFNQIGILHEQQLLCNLRAMVTTEPTAGVMERRTGIPPHIFVSQQLSEVLGKVTSLIDSFSQQTTKVMEAVDAAIEKKAWEGGQVTGDRLKSILNDYQQQSVRTIRSEIDDLKKKLCNNNGTIGTRTTNNNKSISVGADGGNIYCYNG